MRLSSPVGFALRRAVDRRGPIKAPNTTVILCSDASCNTFAPRFVGSRGSAFARIEADAQSLGHTGTANAPAYTGPLAIHNLEPLRDIPKALPPLHLHSSVPLHPT